MPDGMIELDISTPWEAPDGPIVAPGRVRPRRRWVQAAAVLVAVAAVLPAAGPPRDFAPLYSATGQLLSLDAAGERFIVPRYQQGGGLPVLEALDARTGAVLWRRATETGQSLAAITDRLALMRVERADAHGEYTGKIIALDAARGDVRWERDRASFAGLAGDLVLVEDEAWPQEERGYDASYGDPEDLGVALPLLPHHERYVALDQDTGRAVWSAETAPGTVSNLLVAYHPTVRELSDLDASGVLRVRDLATGAVAATYRLDWSGPVAQHQSGVAGQEVVWRAGRSGADVFDRASGRLMWHWSPAGSTYNGPYPCLRDRYCVFGDSATEVLDSATGERLWRADGYSAMLDATDDRLLLTRETGQLFHPDDVAAFDASTGALLWHQHGWLLADGYFSGLRAPGYFVWRPVSITDAVIGRLNLGDGTVEVIGRAPDFYGSPACVAAGGHLGCLAVSTLYVWRLP